jgi:hypothetical protein
VASALTGAAGDGSVLDLILALAIAVAAVGEVTGRVKSGVGVGGPSAPRVARTGGAASSWGTLAGKVWESAAIACVDVGAATSCFGVAGGATV